MTGKSLERRYLYLYSYLYGVYLYDLYLYLYYLYLYLYLYDLYDSKKFGNEVLWPRFLIIT